MIRIAIVDDKPTNRRIVFEKLSGIGTAFSVIMQCVDGEDFIRQMKERQGNELPQIVLMDVEMPNMDGIAAIGIASALYPEVKFVVLSVFDDEDKIFSAIKAGACGYLLKEESRESLINMLTNLYETGAGPISPSIAYKILQMVQSEVSPKTKKTESDAFNLSQREREILELLSQGYDYKAIGDQLFISANTVKKHCINIYQKLHANGRTQALRIAYMRGLIY